MASEQEILSDLAAPVKSFRLMGLEQAISEGSTQELLTALEAFQREETDEECLHLFPHAIEAVQARVKGERTIDPRSLTPQSFPELYARNTPPLRLRLLLSLPRKLAPDLIEWAIGEFLREENPAIKARFLGIFGRAWPRDKLHLLLSEVFGKYAGVRVAAMEALIAIVPNRLMDHFSDLLKEEDPRIMATAIKGLSRVDEEEAVKYIEHELLGNNPMRKLAILRVAAGLPFQLVREPLLKLLTLEQDLTLLEKAGLIFHLNPDPRVPPRLLDIMNQADPRRRPALKEAFDGSWKVIQNSNLLGDRFLEYFSELTGAAQKQELLKSVHQAVTNLESEDETEREAGKAALSLKSRDPDFQEAVKKVATLPITQVQRETVERIITALPPLTGSEPEGTKSQEKDLGALNPMERCRLLAGLKPEKGDKALELIISILKDDRAEVKVKAVALRAAVRLGFPHFRDWAHRWIHRAEETLAVSSLEYLEKFDPDGLMPKLGVFHKSNIARVRILAMRILWRQDPEQAMSSILAVLKNPNQRSRSLAFSALMGFDFPLIRESLVDFLTASQDQEILEPILLLFQNNPAPENLFLLYRLEKSFNADTTPRITKIREENAALVERLKLISPPDLKSLQESFPLKWKELQARKASPPAYALGRQKKPGRELFAWMNVFSDSINELGILAALGVLVFCLSWVAVGALQGPGNKSMVESGALFSGPVKIEGIITGFENNAKDIVIQTPDQTKFQVRISNESKKFAAGEKISATVRPHRKANGIIYARFAEAEKP